ncbi:NADH-quinone oxidoreductase subunit C [Streptomyces sp. JV184]|uniref:NADH-quinone oxidoreductase subunit C n=1 Tax=Streptomyces sp. JV184 TaxID=858637 RepID=UPI002E798E0F|nr:NADH-quinone oxidoreductase subunit C [Streptomyces sp. JV184]MEE1750207.1 NADH-quinone oxidoreductase subunit C [Streptomyces sp. JV184]
MTTTPPAGAPGANPAGEAYDRLPDAAAELFGEGATAEYAYDLLTVDVPAAAWIAALETARDLLGCTYFDWLSAVDEPGTGFRVCAHVAALGGGGVRRLMIRTTVPHGAAVLPTAIDVYAGAAWHERETHEMFGIGFDGHPHLVPLLLPEGFEGHPLRKDFVLAARVAKAWPGAKEPGESEHGGPKRRTMLPPGVPDPNEWGPLKGQLPPAPSRPARTPRAAGDRPARRTRSASEGSAAQRTATAAPAPSPEAGAGASPDAGTGTTPRATTPRRTRSASQGSASQQPASRPEKTVEPGTGTGAGTGTETGAAEPSSGTSDAPWHHARPAFEAGTDAGTDVGAGTDASAGTGTGTGTEAGAGADATPETPPKTPETSKSSGTPESSGTPDHPAGGDTE